MTGTMRIRLTLGTLGIVGITYGGVRILLNARQTNPKGILEWLVGVVVIHDGVIAPLTCLLGAGLARGLRARPRRYLQAGLIVGAFLTVIALPEIHRRGSQATAKAWLLQDYQRNLLILLGIVTGLAAASYLVSAARARRQTKHRPSA